MTAHTHAHAGADIDTLLVAPRHIERSDFFSSFKELLFETKNVTNVRVSIEEGGGERVGGRSR